MADKTPFEAFTGRKPGILHLRVFDCVCYIHIPSSLRQKLDSKAEKEMLMGYRSCEKGYMVFISKKIVLSRSVILNENQPWNWKENQMESITSQLVFEGNKEEMNKIGRKLKEVNMIMVEILT